MQDSTRRRFLQQLPAGLAAALLAVRSPRLHAESATTIPQSALLEPAAAAALLQKPDAGHWKILQVGFRSMFDQQHIRGAVYAGPASQPTGQALLRSAVASLPRTAPILLYCGCCPWTHCPNIAPAWDLLHGMGFRNVHVIHFASNFGDDWVAKGYPVA